MGKLTAPSITKSITADILSFENGMEHYDDVKRIRLKAKNYNLLIMTDYIPMIGELKGDIQLTFLNGEEKVYKGVHGFYRHAHNEFEFILKGKIND